MAQVVPWYYKLYWKMEGWLASKAYKSQNSHSNFFGRMQSEAGSRNKNTLERLKSAPAVKSKAFSHQKPLHNTIFLALPVEQKPDLKIAA